MFACLFAAGACGGRAEDGSGAGSGAAAGASGNGGAGGSSAGSSGTGGGGGSSAAGAGGVAGSVGTGGVGPAGAGGMSGGGGSAAACDEMLGPMKELLSNGTRCMTDGDCFYVGAECTPFSTHCAGVTYAGIGFDQDRWYELMDRWFAECTGGGCAVCDAEPPPPACIDGTCGAGTFGDECPDRCVEELQWMPDCATCACASCAAEWCECSRSAACADARDCMLKTGCRGVDCYAEHTCRSVLDASGVPPMAVRVTDCLSATCPAECRR